jgi:hypothetical protein
MRGAIPPLSHMIQEQLSLFQAKSFVTMFTLINVVTVVPAIVVMSVVNMLTTSCTRMTSVPPTSLVLAFAVLLPIAELQWDTMT